MSNYILRAALRQAQGPVQPLAEKTALPEMITSMPVSLEVGWLMSEREREKLREQLNVGTLTEVAFDACTFKAVYPNSNFYRFRDEDMGKFAESFTGQPFLRDHDVYHIESRDGTISGSILEGQEIIQSIKLTTERGMRAYLEGQIDRFSIGWYYDGITCSICGEDWLRCNHWPRREYFDGKGQSLGRCELIFENPRGKETSAVNAPAVEGTQVLAQLCSCKEAFQKEQSKMEDVILLPDGSEKKVEVEAKAEAKAKVESGEGAKGAGGAAAQPEPKKAAPDQGEGAGASNQYQDLQGMVSYFQGLAVDTALANSGLSEAGQTAVRALLGPDGALTRPEGSRVSAPERIGELIAVQRTVEASFQDVIKGIEPEEPAAHVNGMRTSLDKVTVAFEALLSGVRPKDGVPPLTGVREMYVLLSGDYDLKGLFHPENVGLANVNSSTMAGLVANAMNKRVVTMFQSYPTEFLRVCLEEDFTNLQDVRWITLGGVGELPNVSEGAAYTELTWDDQTETDAFQKKGGYLGITLETIDKDDVRRVQQAPRALAQSAWLTLSKSFANIFSQSSGVGPTMSDGNALFHANHSNTGTSALSFSAWDSTRTAMRRQTELNSGEPLGGLVTPKFLLVPPDLETTAIQVLASQLDPSEGSTTSYEAINPFAEGEGRGARLQRARDCVICVDFWTDTNNWYTVADPNMYPSIGLAYRYGRTPEIFSVSDPNSGLMFTNDVMPVKVRWFFAIGPTDWRGMYGHVVS